MRSGSKPCAASCSSARRGSPLGLGHADEIALLVGGMADADPAAPSAARGPPRSPVRPASATSSRGPRRGARRRGRPRRRLPGPPTNHDRPRRSRPRRGHPLPNISARPAVSDRERPRRVTLAAVRRRDRVGARQEHWTPAVRWNGETRHARRGPEPLRIEVDARVRGRRPCRNRTGRSRGTDVRGPSAFGRFDPSGPVLRDRPARGEPP